MSSNGRTMGLATSKRHEMTSYSELMHTKYLQHIAVSPALLLYLSTEYDDAGLLLNPFSRFAKSQIT